MRITDGSGAPPPIPPAPEPKPSQSAASAPQTHPSTVVQHALIRGLSVSDQKTLSLDRESGDFELGRTMTYNSVSGNSKLTVTQSASLKVTSNEPKPETTAAEEDPNVFLSKASLNLLSLDGSANAAVASKTFSNRNASLTLSALGAQASGQASLGIDHEGVNAQAAGSASAYLVDARAAVHAGPAQASGDASVGAGVNANAKVALDPLKGDVGVNGGVGAFAGAQANETGGLNFDGSSASESANVGAGIGVDAKLDVGVDKGKIDVSFDVAAYLGVGAGADVSFSLDVPKAADSAWHAITSFL